MFQRFLQWIRDWIGRMVNKSTIDQALQLDIEISHEMSTALQTWSAMYENKSSWLSNDIKSLNLAASIASEIARSVTIEMDLKISGSSRATFLNLQMQRILPHMRKQVEYGSAKGGLIMKPYVYNKRVEVDFIQADRFFPVNFNPNGDITACVFVDQRQVGKVFYTRLELHQMTDGGCEITNVAYRSTSKDNLGTKTSLDAVDDWKDIEPEAKIENIDKPLFAYFRYPLTNNIDTNSPLGVSCFSRAVDLIEQADIQWSNLLWEFESGKRGLYVDYLALAKTDDDTLTLPVKRLYRKLDMGGMKDDFFKEWTPTLREQNILKGLDAILKKIEFTCGLAYGTISDPQSVEKTATEITAAKQRSAATIVDVQKALETALENLLYAIDIWVTLEKLAPRGKYNTEYTFDDSLVVDSATQFAQDLQLVTARLIPKYVWLMRNFHLDEAAAKKMVAEVQAENPDPMLDEEGEEKEDDEE